MSAGQPNAAGVTMGLHGVITRVTLVPPPRYLVEGKEENDKRKDSFLARTSDGARACGTARAAYPLTA
jgi:hypothetical protein